MQASKDTVHLLGHVIKKNGWLDLPAQGTSMFPFIRRGEICRFVPCDAAALKKGDIALFSASSGLLVAHRFYRSMIVDNEPHYLFKGDTNLGFDTPIQGRDIIGKLSSIRRKHKHIVVTRPMAAVWSRMIVSFPLYSRLAWIYLGRRDSL